MRVVVVGAGGHAAVVIEALRAMGSFDIVGMVDPNPVEANVLGVPVIGNDDCLSSLRSDGVDGAILALGNNRIRQMLGARLVADGFSLPPVIHPEAFVSPTSTIGVGVVVMARAVIGTRAHIASFAIINTGTIVEHDNRIETAAHVAPGVALAGSVYVGARSLIGVGSAIRPGIHIGADVVVGAGSVVVTNIPDGAIVAGVPARSLSRNLGLAL